MAILIVAQAGLGVPAGVSAQQESLAPIGGITFDPPRPARIRRSSGNVLRGELIAISEKQVHFRVSNGREFQYELRDVRSISTLDGEFLFNTRAESYAQAMEKARKLSDVEIDGVDASESSTTRNSLAALPRPPIPPVAVVVTPPQRYELAKATPVSTTTARLTPTVPLAAPANVQPQQEIWSHPWFKGGVLVAALLIIVFWWRNRVG